VAALHAQPPFRKDPRVFTAADGMTSPRTTAEGRRRHLQPVVRGRGPQPQADQRGDQEAARHARLRHRLPGSNDKAFKAAEMIAAMAPGDLNKVLFCNSGSEAADTSLKVALAYHRARGEGPPQRVHRPREGLPRRRLRRHERGRHSVQPQGVRHGAAAARGPHALHPRPGEPRLHPQPGAGVAGRPAAELEQRILPLHDPSNVAAIIVEPVAGSAGWYLPPKGYLKRLREICDKHGILLIFDEVITGFGRMGTNFGADFYGVVPDMLNFAKAVTNGVIPLGGVICRDKLYDAMMKTDAPEHVIEFFHGYTYSGHPVAARRPSPRSTCSRRSLFRAPAKWARCWAMRSTAPSRACPT
jgi:beta-alanine--pyruvate transaminase